MKLILAPLVLLRLTHAKVDIYCLLYYFFKRLNYGIHCIVENSLSHQVREFTTYKSFPSAYEIKFRLSENY